MKNIIITLVFSACAFAALAFGTAEAMKMRSAQRMAHQMTIDGIASISLSDDKASFTVKFEDGTSRTAQTRGRVR